MDGMYDWVKEHIEEVGGATRLQLHLHVKSWPLRYGWCTMLYYVICT